MTSEDLYNMQTPKEKEMLQKAKETYEETGYWFSNGVLCVKKDKLWGVINSCGDLVFDFMFIDRPLFEDNGYARAYIARHKCGMIDCKGNVLIDFKYDNVFPYGEDGYARVEKGCYLGTIDREGKEHIKPRMKFQQIRTFHDGIAPAKVGTKWGLIDTEGNHISAFKYYDIEEEKDGFFYTRINTKTDGYLNRNGELVDKPEPFEESNSTYRELNKYGLAYEFIPWMINVVGDTEEYNLGLMLDLNFFKHCAEQTNTQICGFEWDELKMDTVEFNDGRIAITYKFPKPDKEPEAVRGAIIVTDDGYYYVTLEYCSHPGRYMLAFTSTNEHVPLGMYDIEPTEENFTDMLEHTLPFVMKCNPKSVFSVPDDYQDINNAPEDPDNCLNLAKQTPRANCFVQLFPITLESSMPLEAQTVIRNLYEELSENQAIIEVNNSLTAKGYHYVYNIVKRRLEPFGVRYDLMLNVYYGNVSLCVRAMFEEAGMTGERDALIMELMRREEKVTLGEKGIEGWFYDPYDKDSTHPYKMNLAEQSQYDAAFPDHPLSQCREFVRYVIENQ